MSKSFSGRLLFVVLVFWVALAPFAPVPAWAQAAATLTPSPTPLAKATPTPTPSPTALLPTARASLAPTGSVTRSKPTDATPTPTPTPIPSTPWTRQFGGASGDWAFGVAVDTGGNSYVAGTTVGTLTGQTSEGLYDAFVRKYDTSGTEQWTRQFGTSTYDGASGVAVDATGNCYVTGQTHGTFAGQISTGSYDAFVRKYNTSGVEQWTRQFGTGGLVEAKAVAVDSTGSIYVAGSVQGNLPGQTSSNPRDAFVRKYNPSGTEGWTRQFGTSEGTGGTSVAVDSSGNIFVGGNTAGAFTGQSNLGESDVFLRKYDSSGGELWTREFGTSVDDQSASIAVDSSGNAYITGRIGQSPTVLGEAYVRKYNSSGTELWMRQFGTGVANQDVFGYCIALDTSGNVYVSGYTNGTFPGQARVGSYSDVFVRKYNSSGTELGTYQFGTGGIDVGQGIAVDGSGNVYVAGFFGGIDRWTGQPSFEGTDAFVTKNIHFSLDKLAFTTVPQTILPGNVSGVMTIQYQGILGDPKPVSANTTISLLSSSSAARFDASANGAFDGTVTSVTIASGSDSARFYYKDTVPGSATITVAETPSQGWVDATQQVSISGADFTASPASGAAPLTVTFTDQSTTVSSWLWNFGDGTTSASQSPTKTYTQGGNYTISLTNFGTWGSYSQTKANYIKVIEARFSATPTSGLKPLAVSFTGESRGTATGWSWSFGDGTGSTSQNPTKTYNNAGAYNVSLTVTGPAGSSTTTRSGYISVNELQMISGFRQSISSDGVALLDIRINRIRHPVTDVDTPATGGIRSYDFTLTYSGGTTGNAVNVLGTRGVGSFTSPTPDFQNAAGSTRITATQTGSAPQAPLTLAQVAPRIIGSKNVSHTLTLSFNGLTDVTGNGNISQDAPKTFTIQRGDAKNDGTVNITDALFVAQFLAGLRGIGETATDMHAINAASVKTDDITGDKVTITDALFIAQMLAGLRDSSFNFI